MFAIFVSPTSLVSQRVWGGWGGCKNSFGSWLRWLQKQFLLRSMIWLLPGAQGLLSASRGPVRAVHAWGGWCLFRTNWRQFMAVLWKVNLLPSRSLVNFFTCFYLTMLQPWLISHTPETNPVIPPWHKPSWAVSVQVAVWPTLGDTKPFG